jgi:hypothetical protein
MGRAIPALGILGVLMSVGDARAEEPKMGTKSAYGGLQGLLLRVRGPRHPGEATENGRDEQEYVSQAVGARRDGENHKDETDAVGPHIKVDGREHAQAKVRKGKDGRRTGQVRGAS